MEEFIKENENEFLNYIEFRKTEESEIKRLNNEINKVKSDIIIDNLAMAEEPYLDIEQRKTQIQKIKEKIVNLEIGREANRIRITTQSDKDIYDFNSEIEIEKLRKEQERLEKEVTDIIDMCKKNTENRLAVKEAQEKINNMQRVKRTIEQRIKDRTNLLEEMLNRKIELKENVLLKISERMKETINEIEIQIKEKEKTLINVTKIEFDDEDSKYLYELKEKTMLRLETELEQIKKKLQEEKNTFRDIYTTNRSELTEFKKLKEDLNSSDLSKLETYLGLPQEEKQEEERKEEESIKEDEQEEKIIPNAWVPDGYGGWKPGVKSENIKTTLKHKIISLVDKFKSRLSKPKTENTNEVNVDNLELSLAERLHCEIENPEKLDVEYIEHINIEKVFEEEEK